MTQGTFLVGSGPEYSPCLSLKLIPIRMNCARLRSFDVRSARRGDLIPQTALHFSRDRSGFSHFERDSDTVVLSAHTAGSLPQNFQRQFGPFRGSGGRRLTEACPQILETEAGYFIQFIRADVRHCFYPFSAS
jgi:hypothetical protein